MSASRGERRAGGKREVEGHWERQEGGRGRPPCTSASPAVSLSPDCTLSLAIPRFLLRFVNVFTHSCLVFSLGESRIWTERSLSLFFVSISSCHLPLDSFEPFVLTFSLLPHLRLSVRISHSVPSPSLFPCVNLLSVRLCARPPHPICLRLARS